MRIIYGRCARMREKMKSNVLFLNKNEKLYFVAAFVNLCIELNAQRTINFWVKKLYICFFFNQFSLLLMQNKKLSNILYINLLFV